MIGAMSRADDRLTRQLDFIAEIDKLKTVFRRTFLISDDRRENDAEHSWHLAAAAIILREYAAEPINLERVLKMAVVHDLVEIYAGDAFAYDERANEVKAEKESRAAERLFSLAPRDQGREIEDLWREFDAMNSADSRFAAALDRFMPFLHNTLTDGATWKEGRVRAEQVYKRMEPVKTAVPALWPFIEERIRGAVKRGWISP